MECNLLDFFENTHLPLDKNDYAGGDAYQGEL